jgi:hypothetical protein
MHHTAGFYAIPASVMSINAASQLSKSVVHNAMVYHLGLSGRSCGVTSWNGEVKKCATAPPWLDEVIRQVSLLMRQAGSVGIGRFQR